MNRIDYLNREADELDADFIADVSACLSGNVTADQIEEMEDLLTPRFLARICYLVESNQIKCDNWDEILNFLAFKPEYQETYKASLIDTDYIPLVLMSHHRGQTKKISYFHQMVSEYFLDAIFEHKFTKEITTIHGKLLNLTCEKLGSYSGLIARCDQGIITATNSVSPTVRENCTQRIIQDCNQLSNLFGAIGYAQAGKKYLALALTLDMPDKTPEVANRLAAFREEAVKCFLCAYFLRDDEYSNQITQALTCGKGLASLFYDDKKIDFSSPQKLLEVMQDLVGEEAFKRIYPQAKKEVDIEYLHLTPAP